MGLFGFGSKREGVVDLAERYRQKKEIEASSAEAGKSSVGTKLEGQESPEFFETDTPEERKRKLAKRIVDIVNRLDDLSNKIYHLQQRIELLERKASISHSDS